MSVSLQRVLQVSPRSNNQQPQTVQQQIPSQQLQQPSQQSAVQNSFGQSALPLPGSVRKVASLLVSTDRHSLVEQVRPVHSDTRCNRRTKKLELVFDLSMSEQLILYSGLFRILY